MSRSFFGHYLLQPAEIVERILSTLPCETLTRIALERPSSIKKLLPNLADGWLLDDYVAGPENEQLRYLFDDDRLRTLADVSPVVLYGEKSLGKTALIVTLAVRWSRLTEHRPLVITSGAAFCKDYADAVEADDVESFRKRHRQCKMLVMDDLEAFQGKSAAQDELAKVIDVLADSGCPLLISNASLPAATKHLKPNLTSRLSAGYSLQLFRPGKLTREALLEALIHKIDPLVPIGPLIAIANELSVSSLSPVDLSLLVKIAHQNRASDGKINVSIVAALMRQQLEGTAPDLASITKLVCRRLQVRLSDIRGTSRESNIMRARSVSIYLARKLTTLSLLQIGEYFAGRDHSTVLHSVRKVTSQLETDSDLANLCRTVEAELLGRS